MPPLFSLDSLSVSTLLLLLTIKNFEASFKTLVEAVETIVGDKFDPFFLTLFNF